MAEISTIPERSFQARSNLGIIYTQFNELNFFIEDSNKENFYLNLLKKLFPEIEISKIFGLGGKPNVQTAALNSIDSKKDIYIVDQDFDEILNRKKNYPNLFYLERYCIENYLVEDFGICEYIKEEKTTIKDDEFKQLFNLEETTKKIGLILQEIASCCFIIYKYDLGLPYYQININRDLDLGVNPFAYRNNFIEAYVAGVKAKFAEKKPKLKFENQMKLAKRHFLNDKAAINIPGKYYLNLIKFILVSKFGVTTNTTNESFNFRVCKNCQLESLAFLKHKITFFIN